MKVAQLFSRCVAFGSLAMFTPLASAQTCVAAVQASNPTSVYVVDVANGTVTDTRTRLMWDRCALGLSGTTCAAGSASAFTWQAALDAAASVGSYKGFNDWRLPNLKELRSLVEECRTIPSINEFAFPNTPASFFWSGSPGAGVVARAWNVSFDDGHAFSDGRGLVDQVRLVRAGQ